MNRNTANCNKLYASILVCDKPLSQAASPWKTAQFSGSLYKCAVLKFEIYVHNLKKPVRSIIVAFRISWQSVHKKLYMHILLKYSCWLFRWQHDYLHQIRFSMFLTIFAVSPVFLILKFVRQWKCLRIDTSRICCETLYWSLNFFGCEMVNTKVARNAWILY